MPITATRCLEWDALHRVPGHEGKCRAFHGHRYVAELTCSAPALDNVGRIIDFGVLKSVVGGWIDERWDHTAMLMEGDEDPAARQIAASNAGHGRPAYLMKAPPTAENIAAELATQAQQLLRHSGITVVSVRIWETPNSFATWTKAGPA